MGQRRPPMGNLSVNVEPSGTFAARKGQNGYEHQTADILVRRPPSRLDTGPCLADRNHRPQLEILPSFNELFGPLESLPAPKPADKAMTRPSLSPLSAFPHPQDSDIRPDLVHVLPRTARFAHPNVLISPARPAGSDNAPDYMVSKKRKSELVEEGNGHAPQAWRSFSQPISRRVNDKGESTPTTASPFEPSISPVPLKTLGSNWAPANGARQGRLLVSPPRLAERPGAPVSEAVAVGSAYGGYDPITEFRTQQKRPRVDRSVDIAPELDVAKITLEGEASDRVRVFDTCDTVRSKIRTFLTKPGMTQAAFLRAIAATYSDGRRLQGAQLNRFLAMNGPHSGNTSGIFYAAYVFFEKVRLRDGVPKALVRVEMEGLHPNGFNISEVRNHLAGKGPVTGGSYRKIMPE